ncbi:MAG TPA: zf-HC2 domain-containing protein [Thermoanaerobaculia bacterium]|jgi:hypothetical protein
MDHTYIEENDLVERYHRGLLPPEEEARFEEHFVTCPECMEQLELARGFQRGLQAAAAEDAAKAVVQAGVFAWLARRGRLAQWGLALAVLAVVAAPLLWSAFQRQDIAAWRARWQSQQRETADLQGRLAASERRRSDERRELEAKIAAAQEPAARPNLLDRPLANLPIVLLTAVRGEAGEPAATIDLSRAGEPVVLAVDVGAGDRFASYRVTITRQGDGVVFRQAGLEPNALETIMITFPASFFVPGEYRLTLEGFRSPGNAEEIGGYPFRAVAKK